MGGSILQQMLLLCLTHPSSSKAAVIPAPCHLFIIVHFDLQFRQSQTLVAGSCSGCSCRRCSLERGTLQALESAAGEQAGSAAASDHAQVPRFPEQELLTRDATCTASLWGAGITSLGGKVSKPLPNPSLSLISITFEQFLIEK